MNKYNEWIRDYQALDDSTSVEIKNLKTENQTLKDRLNKLIESFSELVRNAIKAVIAYAKAKIYKEFNRDQKEAVVNCLNAYSVPEDMAHNLKVFTRAFLSDSDHEKRYRELDLPLKIFRL